jgi:sugar/nucleoside kinase (ribokinase family)
VSDVTCLGILVADVIARPVDAVPEPGSLALLGEIALRGGGCALNSGTALARLGVEVACAGKVGRDPFGDFLLGLLDERGIDRSLVVQTDDAPTSASIALVDSAGERTFLHVPGANGTLELADLDLDRVLAARALHVAGALVMPALDGAQTAELLAAARARGVATSLDTVWDASGGWERLLPSLPLLDLLCVSGAEAAALSGEREPRRAAAWARERGVGAVAVKLGPDGCWVDGDGFRGHVPPVQVEAVDSTGAGDAFAAGMIYASLQGWPLERAAAFANAVGAAATTAVGAAEGLPTIEEVAAWTPA